MAGFREIVGHEQIIAHLKNAIALDKVSHAYIISGPADCGKRMLAEAFAMTLQCSTVRDRLDRAWQLPTGQSREPDAVLQRDPDNRHMLSPEQAAELDACMECRSCRQALGHNQPDILYLTHEKPGLISVDDIRRQVKDDVCIRPYSSCYKIYIIDEAEKMNVQAQNALLKTIEEPPPYAVLLLLTTSADAFLPTIRSRCVTLECRAVSDAKIRDFLMKKCGVPDYRAAASVAFAQGNVGRAMMLAGSDSFNERKDFLLQLLQRLGGMERYDLFGEAKKLSQYKEEIGEILDLLMFWARDVLICKSTGQTEHLIFQEYCRDTVRQAGEISYAGLQRILDAAETAGRRVRANVSLELTLELLLMTIKENLT